MKKKLLLIPLALMVISLVAIGCPAEAPAPAPEAAPEEGPIVWKVQGFVPAGMIYHNTLLHFGETLEKATNGRLILDVHPKGAIVPVNEQLIAVHEGALDACYGFAGQYVGKMPAAPLFTSVPGSFETVDCLMWLEHGGGNELYQEMFDTYGYNVKVFPLTATSMQIFQWSNKPIRTLDDFKGLKMRMMPLMGDVLKEHGISVAFLPAGEIIPALERGVIDAAEYATPAFDLSAGFNKVCKYYHYPGLHQPSCILDLYINKDKYDALPDDLKYLLDIVVSEEILSSYLSEEDLCLKALEEFDKGGNELVRMDDETVKTLLKWSADYLDEQAAKDAFFAKVLESIRAWEKVWYPYVKANRLVRE